MKLKYTNWIGMFALLSIIMTGVSFGDKGDDLDEFDDLELEALDTQNIKAFRQKNDGQRLILFDDNLYLLDDDFDFGEDELELQKLELNPDDIETAQEYENFLNAFFENSVPVGYKTFKQSNPTSQKHSKTEKSKKNSKSKSLRNPTQKPRNNVPASSFRPRGGNLGFSVSTMIGATIPIGANLKQFGAGSNFGVRLDTPISFSLAGMEAGVGTEIYFSSMSAGTPGDENYKLTNIVGNVSLFPTSSIEIRTGLGLSPASIGDYSTVALSIPVDLNYYLPMDLSGFKIALNLHAQMTMGYPNDGSLDGGEGATTEFINIGLFINTPFTF